MLSISGLGTWLAEAQVVQSSKTSFVIGVVGYSVNTPHVEGITKLASRVFKYSHIEDTVPMLAPSCGAR